MRLMREIRFYMGFFGPDVPTVPRNTWAGTYASGLGAFWTLRAGLDGSMNPRTGYLCDIKLIDDLLRSHVQPRLTKTVREAGASLDELAATLGQAIPPGQAGLPAGIGVGFVELALSPHTRITVLRSASNMVTFTQSFEFAASHRLSCSDLTETENRKLFGKCSNPHGHGHNYVVEVSVAGEPSKVPGNVVDVTHLDQVVRERVVEPFDHRNLNIECPEFAGMNPTVENIAKVIWDRLEGSFERCRLQKIRVWETPKTYAEYTGVNPS